MRSSAFQNATLVFLAAVFTIGLTFASLELPYLADRVLDQHLWNPGFDSHADAASRFKTELYIQHYHLRLIGYVCVVTTLLLIIGGFILRRSTLALAGAFVLILPVFAQFAAVMFFLAGLGLLNVVWLPLLDLSLELPRLGMIIRAPFDLLMWLFGLVHWNAYWPLVILCTASGLLIFFLATVSWLQARQRGRDVADFWLYRISRHPQYLGWMLWTYGIFLLLLQARYPKRTWGIDPSLAWLLSTLVIVGIAWMEEINMTARFGESYAAYRRRTPFLFPLPALAARLLSLPMKILRCPRGPRSIWEVVGLLVIYTVLFVSASSLLYLGGLTTIHSALRSEGARQEAVGEVIERLKLEAGGRLRGQLIKELTSYGEFVIPQVAPLLRADDPATRSSALEILTNLEAAEAVNGCLAALSDPEESVCWRAIDGLTRLRVLEAKEPIAALLQHQNRRIRLKAIQALAHLGGNEWIGQMLAGLQAPEGWYRQRVAEALGELGSEAAVPALMESAGDRSAVVRAASIVALMKIGSPKALRVLEVAEGDESPEVRLYAREALKALGRTEGDGARQLESAVP